MTTITNQSGSKLVNIRKNMDGFSAMYCQVYNGEQQVLESKQYASEKRAISWANKKLGK
jgi:hypothetical protein